MFSQLIVNVSNEFVQCASHQVGGKITFSGRRVTVDTSWKGKIFAQVEHNETFLSIQLPSETLHPDGYSVVTVKMPFAPDAEHYVWPTEKQVEAFEKAWKAREQGAPHSIPTIMQLPWYTQAILKDEKYKKCIWPIPEKDLATLVANAEALRISPSLDQIVTLRKHKDIPLADLKELFELK